MIVGIHFAHEQHAPSSLLELAKYAEAVGFRAAMCSDHFHPWSVRQGQSGFAWSWLGSALQATRLSFGTVCAPGQRYHPAVVAQAAATLAEMYDDRFWLALGTGEALNETITGSAWPTKQDRQARLRACVDIMRALWAGEVVSHSGHVHVREARLYTRPSSPPLLLGAALTSETARWVGGWADGLMTGAGPRAEMRARSEAFREGGGAGKPIFLQVALAYAKSDADAAREAHDQWRQSALMGEQLANLTTPLAFDAATQDVTRDDVVANIRVSADIDRHIDWVREDAALGISHVYLHNVVRDQRRFLDACGTQLVPAFAGAGIQADR
jgi:coenzyme F420-dependent glucose-6-phosphate dehydrogenase